MTPTQFRDAIDKVGLSQVGTARLLGTDPRTARRWALGESDIPDSVAILLRLLVTKKITTKDIEKVT